MSSSQRYGTVFYDDWNIEFVFNEINFNVFGHRNSTKVGIRYKIKTNMNTEVVANEIVARLGAVENAIVNEK